MREKSIHIQVALIITGLLQFSCNNDNSGTSGVMLNFDFARREVKTVHPQLQEISGILFLNDGQKMAAVNDEDGTIFIIDFAGKEQSQPQEFGGPVTMKILLLITIIIISCKAGEGYTVYPGRALLIQRFILNCRPAIRILKACIWMRQRTGWSWFVKAAAKQKRTG
ncbi:MAG: hypothetical protein HC867_02180 [Bacteroidia bacterium]|nr:hypothetical protein [Bacteroidia bacterium]